MQISRELGNLGRRNGIHVIGAVLALLGMVAVIWPSAASAEDPGFLTISKGVTGWTDGQVVEPGEKFVYTITMTCSNTGSGGCTSAVLTDSLPEGIVFDPDGTVSVQGASADVATSGSELTVTFTEPLDDPAGGQGLPAGSSVTVQVPVMVDPDISAELDGQDVTNTATVDGTNTDPASDDFTVVPDIPVDLAATTSKSFEPASAVAAPGTATALTLNGGTESNVAVDEITMTDPADPSATPNAFTYLGLSGPAIDVTMPEGAEEVQVDVWVAGAWVEGTPEAPPATIPAGVQPGDVEGVRITFISTDDDGIPSGAEGSASLPLEQRDNIADAGEGPIPNEVSTTVAAGSEESDPVTGEAAYTLTSADLDVGAGKSFDPAEVVVGGQSTVTLTGTNASDRTLESMTITEPSSAPNPFENGLTFTGWTDGVVWPSGATGATVTYQLAGGQRVTEDATEPNTLPDPPPPGAEVVGFTVEFTGPIVPGAEATVPFVVTAAETQVLPEVAHPNEVGVETTAAGGFSGEATDSDTLTTIQRRIAVDVDKRIEPGQIFSIPGQIATVLLTGTLEPFPASTTDATEIIVQDPADLEADTWYDTFAPTTIAETPIPADSTMTVQYWDGSEWVDVPGMVDLAGPQIFTGDLPPEVRENAQGIRFVYHSDDGFARGTEVSPNIDFELRPEAAGQDIEVENCAASSASAPDARPDDASMTECPVIDVVPPDPGNADFIDKAWDDPKVVGERTGEEAGATLAWSTSGASNIDQMYVSDVPAPSAETLPDTVFDPFDLVRIDPITAESDPHLTYDRVARVELYSLAAGGWVDAPDDPCPEACDGTFPGYELSAASQQDTIAFRLVFEESPTRADRIGGDPTAPPVGSGVARSSGNDRDIHPVFRIRDDLRSDPDVPVVSDAVYNVAGEPSEVRNTARASVIVDGSVYVDQDASDTITISPVPVTVTMDKEWSGGPLDVPPADTTFPDDWPTARMSLDAANTTPRQVDRLTITEPTGLTDPFDTFNLRGFVSVTDPASIGADDVTIALELADGGTRELSRDEALAAAESDLTDVVGFTVAYTGRIDEGAHARVVLDTRLRPAHRADGSPIEPGTTVDNRATAAAADLVDYPGVDPVTSTASDTASIALQEIGIGLEVTKSFAPSEQTEPDRSPVTMTLSGQPSGPSRTNKMVLTDRDASFWNQYDFTGFGDLVLTPPIDRVQVDALVGGTYAEDGGGVVLEGGDWVEGEPGTTPTLPDGVSEDDVQGLRFTFTREDGAIWENPATPLQQVPVEVQRRESLHTGGPVPSDLAGNEPAPGEENAGEATNSITGDNYGADQVGGEPIHGTDDAEATIRYRHANNAVEVTKTPSGAQAPSSPIPYTMTFTNTGDTAITDPVITDRLPSDGDGPLLVLNPDTTDHYTYALDGDAPDPPNGPAMPTDPGDVTVEETPTVLTFTFPEGTVLEVGQTYTVTVDLIFRPGLPGDTQVTNTAGITGERPWDECETTLDESGECRTATTVHPTRAGALRGTKTVKAAGDDDLGVIDTRQSGCTADADGFYSGGCVPVTKPGSDEIWRMSFVNTGNLPMDKVYAVDRLPAPGDTGAIVTLPRDSEWRPTPKSVSLVGAELGTVSQIRVYYDADDDLCTADLETLAGCPDGEWTLIDQADDPPVGWSTDIPAGARALKFEMDFADDMLQPTGSVKLDLTTTTPGQSPTAGADTIAWNTVAQAGETNDGGAVALAPESEGNKVGVALATGSLEIQKLVRGGAADEAPPTFVLDVTCVDVDGQEVELGEQSEVTLTPPEVVRIDDLPWGAECSVTEDAGAGATHFSADPVTIGYGTEDVARIRAVNTYSEASLVLRKTATDSAVDQDGNPVTYGPFSFDVACTFLGEPVFADGYDANDPMTASFSSGESVTFNGLPAGSECTATETDTAGAASTTATGSTGEGPVTPGEETIELALTEDRINGAATNEVTFDNVFDTGSLVVTKVVDGEGAELYDAGPFTIHLSCTDADDQPVWDGDVVLGGDQPLTRTIENLYAGAVCTASEDSTGGATTSTISPQGPFEIVTGQPVTVTATNTFDLGAVQVTKNIVGAGADEVGPDESFTVRLACTRDVDGTAEPVALPGGEERVLSRATEMVVTYDRLPVGATCAVSETDAGGADGVTILPDRLTVGAQDSAQVFVTNTFSGSPDDGPSADPADPGGAGQDLGPSVGPESHTGASRLDDHSGLLFAALMALAAAVAGWMVLICRRRP
ncbi:DUF5979 domain-containing protein [Nocardioides sp. NPDC127503]|uniref:DUF5979 domain-containing protein n=1 Tax=Nocardioides sp. NPDC127503 TaxID=3154516 RepID=UPI0033181092